MKISRWIVFALATPVLWGVWGALTEYPEKWITPPFPATLGYVVWSLTMIPVSLFVLWKTKWKVDTSPRSILYGCAVGVAQHADVNVDIFDRFQFTNISLELGNSLLIGGQ